MKNEIKYVNGDATKPIGEGTKLITHICNDIGGWGRGFVLSLSKEHPAAETAYRSWYQGNPPEAHLGQPRLSLGEVQYVESSDGITVVNMIAQHGIFTKDGIPPIRYDALASCLSKVAAYAGVMHASVHMPRIGCGLAGGKWSEIEKIVNEELIAKGVLVCVYDFDTQDARTIPWKK
jgi:O-acetyl-ADP-ribose deacetylase (regulator of RNase III)